MRRKTTRTTRIVLALLLAAFLSASPSGIAFAEVLQLPSNLLTVEQEAFYGDKSIVEAEIPYGTKTIGERAFAYSGLKIINIPDTVSSIADDAFQGVESLTIYCSENSNAKYYAETHGITWKSNSISPSDVFELTIPKGVIISPTYADVTEERMLTDYHTQTMSSGEWVYCQDVIQSTNGSRFSFVLIYEEGIFEQLLIFGGDPEGKYIYNVTPQTSDNGATMTVYGSTAQYNGSSSVSVRFDADGNLLSGNVDGQYYSAEEMDLSGDFNPPRLVIHQTEQVLTIWQ